MEDQRPTQIDTDNMLENSFCNNLQKARVLKKKEDEQTQIYNTYITETRSLPLHFVGSGPETSEAAQTAPPARQKKLYHWDDHIS